MTCCDTLSEKNNQLKIDISKLENKEFDLQLEVKRLREQLLQGVMYMHMTSTQTKNGRIYNAEKFERQVREMIE